MRSRDANTGKSWSVPGFPMIAAVDDLLAMKRIANRPKDRLNIAALEKLKRGEDPNV